MTPQEAEQWFRDGIDEAMLITIIEQWGTLKSSAGHKFAVATGMDDWVGRFIDKVQDLQDANGERMVLVRAVELSLLEMKKRLSNRPCRNCRGLGEVKPGETCVCCRGNKTFDL